MNPVCGTRAIFVKEINNPSENEAGSDRPTDRPREERLTDRLERSYDAQICPKSWKMILAGKSRREQNSELVLISRLTDDSTIWCRRIS